MKRSVLICCFVLAVCSVYAQGYRTEKDVPYRTGASDEYIIERCVLDVYYPEDREGFGTVVWLHGGGLTGGNKHIPELLKEKGICVVALNYRLSPKVSCPVYIEDAAAGVAWVFKNIHRYGGDPSRIYVAGHSAGGYLTSMVALDKSYLAVHGVDADEVRAYFPFSGQGITHMQTLRERGLPDTYPVIDNYAPVSHIRKDTAPIHISAGENDLEMKWRTAENKLYYEALKSVGNENVYYHEFSGFSHNTMSDPGILLMLEQIAKDAK